MASGVKNNGEIPKTTFIPKIPVIAGIFAAVAGVFLLLAAYQVLPQGVNAISQLGVAGYGLGYSIVALGIGAMAVGAIIKLCWKEQTPVEKTVEPPKPEKAPPVPFQRCNTLEELFKDEEGFLESIPEHPEKIDVIQILSNSGLQINSTQALIRNHSGADPLIIVKIVCASTTDELMANPLITKTQLGSIYTGDALIAQVEAYRNVPAYIFLFRHGQQDKRTWQMLDTKMVNGYHAPIIAANFIRGCYMSGRDDRSEHFLPAYNRPLNEAKEAEGMEQIKKLIKGEVATDVNGVRWRLARG